MIIPPHQESLTKNEKEAFDSEAQREAFAEPPPYSPPNTVHATTSRAVMSSDPVDTDQKSEDWTQPSFSRMASFPAPPPPFTEEMHLVARSSLTQGFPMVCPPFAAHSGQLHPFTTHDVTEQDWLRFLQDVRSSASPTEEQLRTVDNIVSHIPVVNIIGGVVTRTVRQLMKSQRRKSIPLTLENWNHHFFRPRGMEVVLTQGRWKLGNQSARAPRSLGGCENSSHLTRKDNGWDGLTERELRKESRRERREVRRERKRERHGGYHDHPRHHESQIPHDGAFRLWVLPLTS